MTKKKSTKRALISSLLILAMCFTMLVGTTFAWFTDEVASGSNRILAGKLDVDLVMWDGTDYKSIADGQGDIFKEADTANDSTVTLWEPGKTQIVFLGVENKGNLAAKYNILLNVVDGGLIGSLEYAIINGDQTAATFADWAAVKTAAGANTGDLTSGIVVAAPNGQLFTGTAKTADYFALAVHMKEDAGNKYQEKDVTIDVKVVATQLNYEEDSFGPDYDKDAELPTAIFPVANATELADALAEADDGDIIALTADYDDVISVENGKAITLDLGGKEVKGVDLKNGSTVTLQNGTVKKEGGQPINIREENNKLVVAKDVTIEGKWGICLFSPSSTVDMYGTINGDIFVSGNVQTGNSVVNVYGTVKNTGDDRVGIAVNGMSTVNVYEGAVIEGGTGIEVRAGNLNVYGGTITGTAIPDTYHSNGSGTSTQGAGLAVAQHTTKLPINVYVEGGTFRGYVALLQVNPENNSDADLDQITINIQGGTFETINGGDPALKYSVVNPDKIHYTNVPWWLEQQP